MEESFFPGGVEGFVEASNVEDEAVGRLPARPLIKVGLSQLLLLHGLLEVHGL